MGDAFRHGSPSTKCLKQRKLTVGSLIQIEDIIKTENQIKTLGFGDLNADNIRSFKRKGLSDLGIADLMGISQKQFRKHRWNLGVTPVYKRVDILRLRFESDTAYMYSTYDEECEANPSTVTKSW